jgi:hypothetical protein
MTEVNQTPTTPVVEKPKSTKKLIIIVLVALLALFGGIGITFKVCSAPEVAVDSTKVVEVSPIDTLKAVSTSTVVVIDTTKKK